MADGAPVPGLQAWGGLECTVNRVGDRWFSQLDRPGCAGSVEDLDRVAALGIRTLRFPVLWERVAPDGLDRADWSWTDARLARLRELGIAPIAGLLHHGSGPRGTSLVDPAFPEAFAAYAQAVARRYPWVTGYTPVNEPLTTARFSALYGHWYPHARDPVVFRQALFNQCRGVVLAMRAIERVQPAARLIQTDDLGTTHAAPALAYQAAFANHLRWLAWDLLCGRVDDAHPLHGWLIDVCATPAEDLAWFRHNARAPDVIGINHYVTSDRYLDDRLALHPPALHGGNGRDRYADVEAVRALDAPGDGIAPLLSEAWARYRIPLAVTEAHLDAGREDQLRWLADIWAGAQAARAGGADVRAVTAWGLFGAYDWNSLLTRSQGYYESGAFDVRSGAPRATAVAALVTQLAAGGPPRHPVLAGAGWWRRPGRHGDFAVARCAARGPGIALDTGPAPPILVFGAGGTLGRAFLRLCERRGLAHVGLSRADVDIADADAVARAIDRHQPWAVVNAAGYVRVDEAERDAERCFRENALGAATIAACCARNDVAMVTFSTDLVFDGARDAPYVETDATSPLGVYGHSKARAEALTLDAYPGALVVRTSAFFGPWDSANFVTGALGALRRAEPFAAANDSTVTPTYVPDLVNTTLDLLIDRACGLWHLSNGHPLTWAEFALRAAALARVDAATLRPCRGDALRLVARRPRYSALGSTRGAAMPTLESALGRYLGECVPS